MQTAGKEGDVSTNMFLRFHPMYLRACLKSFDKRETVIDNRGKRVGDEENASISE